MNKPLALPTLGVVVVTYNAADVILDCLESLLRAQGVALDILVVDNASTDETPALLHDWLAGGSGWTPPQDCPFGPLPPRPDLDCGPHRITLHEAGVNGGFAAGVNLGLSMLLKRPELERF